MSLINDMLRNLETKRPDDLARQNLQREIRTLPAASAGRGRTGKWLLFSSLLLVTTAAAILHAGGHLLPLLGLEPTPAVVAVPPAVPPAPPPMAPVVTEPVDEKLRLASNLEVLPLPAAPILPVPDPVAPTSVSTPKTDLAAATPEAPKPATPVSAGPVKIEKSPIAATPRDRADAEYRKAENALASGRSAEALEGMRAALKQDPSYVQVRQALLRQLLDLRKTEEAMAVLQEGLELQAAQTGWAMSLARLQLEHGDLAAADRTLARSQAYAEANADYAGFQGHLKSRLGAQRQAAGYYQRATRLAPNEGRWWLGLGLALEADGHLPEAKDAFKRGLASGTLSADLSAIAEQHLR
jgi:MSHA biogenesis protein MshN